MTFNENYFKVLNLIKSANIVSLKQMDEYCLALGMNTTQKETLIKFLISKRELFIDASGSYYTSTDSISYQKFTPALEKTLWFYIKNCKQFEYCNFTPKIPASAYMCSTNPDEEFNDLTVFYIPEGTEKVQSRVIETVYGGMPSKVPTALIASNPESFKEVILSENFDIKKLIVIDNEGNISELE